MAKPGRDFYLAACRLTGLPPHECVYVGDRLDSDARGSRTAGMRGIWLDRWRCEAPADVEVIHSLTELPARLSEVRVNGRVARETAIV